MLILSIDSQTNLTNICIHVKANPRDFYRYVDNKGKDALDIPPLKKKTGSGIFHSGFENKTKKK